MLHKRGILSKTTLAAQQGRKPYSLLPADAAYGTESS